MNKYIGFREFFLDLDSYYDIEIRIPGEYEFESEEEGDAFFSHTLSKLFLTKKGFIAQEKNGNTVFIEDYKIRKLLPNQIEEVTSLEDFDETNIEVTSLYNSAVTYAKTKTSIKYNGKDLEAYNCASVSYWFEKSKIILEGDKLFELEEILLNAEEICELYLKILGSHLSYNYLYRVLYY